MNKTIKLFLFLTVLILTTAAAFMAGRHMPMMMHDMPTVADAESMGSDAKIMYWVAPMDTNFRRDKPGKSPMGMDLVPVYENDSGVSGADVSISPSMVQNLGVKTETANLASANVDIDTVGFATWPESSLHMLHPRAEGWIDRFSIKSVGQRVNKGQVLYEVFSPKLVSAQREYLVAVKSGNRGLKRASAERLIALGFTDEQISTLQRDRRLRERLPYKATRDSVVTDLQARAGMYVSPQTNIATLADLSSIWVEVEVLESDSAYVRQNLPVTARFKALESEPLKGIVAFVYPELNANTRTLRVRIEVPNPEEQIKPNMFASVTIHADPKEAVLQIPTEAVIRSGQGDRVIVQISDGGFDVKPVRTGKINGRYIEVLNGLQVGDAVVTSGQFLLDSEANGAQAMARLQKTDDVLVGQEPMNSGAMEHPGAGASMGSHSMEHPGSDAPKESHGMKMSPKLTHAVVEEVLENGAKVRLDHAAIESLGMQAMSMIFQVPEHHRHTQLQVGDAVMFDAVMKPDQGAVISQLEKHQ